jgi:D-aspartate ligase
MLATVPSTQTPAVVVGGSDNCGGLGVVRSLGQAGVEVIVVDCESTAPALHSRHARKVVVPELSGYSLVQNLLTLQASLPFRPVLFLTSDEAVLTVSEYRAELQPSYRLRLPDHDCLASLMKKSDFHRLALEHGFPVPHSVPIRSLMDLRSLAGLNFPAVIKPSIKTEDYLTHQFERGYPVASVEQAESVIRHILPVLPDLIVQEWIEGSDSAIYFCLMYCGGDGPVSSFTGRKLSIWPPGVGTTASCMAAPEAHAELHLLTKTFFEATSFIGMGGMEYKRDARTGQFLMIEPTVGRVDWQEEVATLNGVNIPLAAYLHEIGAEVPMSVGSRPVIWRDGARHWKSTRVSHATEVKPPNAKVRDAYWRLDDPLPALFHAITTFMRTLRRALKRHEMRRSSNEAWPQAKVVRASTGTDRDGHVTTGSHACDLTMPRDVIPLGRNFLLSLGGEGLQSGFHFILTLILIRVLSAHDFGIFAIAFILGGISLTYGNALVSTPATMPMSRLKSPGAVDFQDVAFGSMALVISAGIAVIVMTGLWFAVGQMAEAIAGGTFTGLWTLRNHVRSVMFARHAMVAATLSDLTYAVSGILFVAIVLLLLPELPQLSGALLALTCANIVAIFVALRVLGGRMRISFRPSIWRRYRTIWSDVVWSLVGTTAWTIQGQGLMFLVAATVGPAAYAPIAIGALLFTPLRPAISALINVFRPGFAANLARRQFYRLRVTMYSIVAFVVLSCIGVSGAIWLGWPLLDTYIFGGKFANASMPLIVVLSGIAAAIYFTYNIPLALVQAASEFRPVAVATTFGAIIGLTSVSVLLAVTSVAWSLAGFVAGEAVCGVCLWMAALHILRQRAVPTRTQPAAPVDEAELRTGAIPALVKRAGN